MKEERMLEDFSLPCIFSAASLSVRPVREEAVSFSREETDDCQKAALV
jgi:hypothetical protein